jgi:uncharacterized protein YfdQ (DUF2303 family)
MLPLDTLTRIEQLVNADNIRSAISDALRNPTLERGETPTVVLPDGTIIDCEPYAPHRARPRGQFSTHSIGAFAAFLGETGIRVPVCIDVSDLTAKAFIDHGQLSAVVEGSAAQRHCKLTAILRAKATAPWVALRNVAAPPSEKAQRKPARFGQQELAEFLVDWRTYCRGAWHLDDVPADAMNPPLTTSGAISAIRSVKVKAEGERTDTVSALAREAAAKESLRIEGDATASFPSIFRFVLSPFIGFRYREIDVRLNVYVQKGEPPEFSLSIIGYDALVEDLGDEFAALIREAIPANRADILLGHYVP